MLKKVVAPVCPARAAVISGVGVVALLVVNENVGMWLRDEGRNPSGRPVVECNVYQSALRRPEIVHLLGKLYFVLCIA